MQSRARQRGKQRDGSAFLEKVFLICIAVFYQCAKLYAKHGYGPGLGIDPSVVSYVQPVAIVPAGAPIAAIPIGPGGGYKGHHKGIKAGYGPPKGTYGVPNVGYGAPPPVGLPPIGLNSLAPPPLGPLAGAGVQHLHHHHYDNGVGYKKGGGAVGYSPAVPSAPVYNNPPPPSYNPPPPPPPPRPVYNNPPPPPVYNPPPPPVRPGYGGGAPNPSYSNQAAVYSPREQCVCVAVEQCPSYDIISRVQSDYQLDPRKANTTISAEEEGAQLPLAEARNGLNSTRRRRQSFHRLSQGRQTIIGDDSITVISSEVPADFVPPTVGGGGGGIGGGVIGGGVIGGGVADSEDSISVDAPISDSPSADVSSPVNGGIVGGGSPIVGAGGVGVS